jgi:hypothetical protein
MTTTPLLPLPEAYDIDDQERRFWHEQILARDAQWQAYAAQARADLEAENQRLREALTHAVEIAEGKRPGAWDDLLQYRSILKDTK